MGLAGLSWPALAFDLPSQNRVVSIYSLELGDMLFPGTPPIYYDGYVNRVVHRGRRMFQNIATDGRFD